METRIAGAGRNRHKKVKTSNPQINASAGFLFNTVGVPTHIGSELTSVPDTLDSLWFVEVTSYPQRSALEPLLTID